MSGHAADTVGRALFPWKGLWQKSCYDYYHQSGFCFALIVQKNPSCIVLCFFYQFSCLLMEILIDGLTVQVLVGYEDSRNTGYVILSASFIYPVFIAK